MWKEGVLADQLYGQGWRADTFDERMVSASLPCQWPDCDNRIHIGMLGETESIKQALLMKQQHSIQYEEAQADERARLAAEFPLFSRMKGMIDTRCGWAGPRHTETPCEGAVPGTVPGITWDACAAVQCEKSDERGVHSICVWCHQRHWQPYERHSEHIDRCRQRTRARTWKRRLKKFIHASISPPHMLLRSVQEHRFLEIRRSVVGISPSVVAVMAWNAFRPDGWRDKAYQLWNAASEQDRLGLLGNAEHLAYLAEYMVSIPPPEPGMIDMDNEELVVRSVDAKFDRLYEEMGTARPAPLEELQVDTLRIDAIRDNPNPYYIQFLRENLREILASRGVTSDWDIGFVARCLNSVTQLTSVSDVQQAWSAVLQYVPALRDGDAREGRAQLIREVLAEMQPDRERMINRLHRLIHNIQANIHGGRKYYNLRGLVENGSIDYLLELSDRVIESQCAVIHVASSVESRDDPQLGTIRDGMHALMVEMDAPSHSGVAFLDRLWSMEAKSMAELHGLWEAFWTSVRGVNGRELFNRVDQFMNEFQVHSDRNFLLVRGAVYLFRAMKDISDSMGREVIQDLEPTVRPRIEEALRTHFYPFHSGEDIDSGLMAIAQQVDDSYTWVRFRLDERDNRMGPATDVCNDYMNKYQEVDTYLASPGGWLDFDQQERMQHSVDTLFRLQNEMAQLMPPIEAGYSGELEEIYNILQNLTTKWSPNWIYWVH